MRPHTLKLEAGERVTVAAAGDYVRVHSAAGEVMIENTSANSSAFLRRGGSVRFGAGQAFVTIDVVNAETVGQTVTIYVGRGGEIEQTSEPVINGGSVAVIQNIAAVPADTAVVIAPNAKKLTIKSSLTNSSAVTYLNFTDAAGIDPTFSLEPGESYSVDSILIGPEGLELHVASVAAQLEVIYWV